MKLMMRRRWESPVGRVSRWLLRAVRPAVALVPSFLLLAPVPGEGSLSIRPAYLQIELGKGRPSESITVENITNEEARYRIQVIHFNYDQGGNIVMIPPDEHSMATWIKCNPLEFTLAPKASRAIRLTIIQPKSLVPGEYWAAVWFEPLTWVTSTSADSMGHKVSLKVETNILIPVIGRTPGVVYKADLAGLSATKTKDGIDIAATVLNPGTGRVRLKGNYEILNAAKSEVAHGLIGEDTIMAGGKRIFKQEIKGKFPDAEYLVRVQYASESLPAVLAGEFRLR